MVTRAWAVKEVECPIAPPSLHLGPFGAHHSPDPFPLWASGSAFWMWTLPLVASCPRAQRGRGWGEQSWPQNRLQLNIGSVFWERAGSIKMGRRGSSWAENCLSLCLSFSVLLLFLPYFPLWAVTVHIGYWVLSSWIFPSCSTSLGLIYGHIRLRCLWSLVLCPCGKQVLSSVWLTDVSTTSQRAGRWRTAECYSPLISF